MIWLYWAICLTVATFVSAYLIKKDRNVGYTSLVCFLAVYVVAANILVKRVVFLNLGIGIYITATGALIFPFISQALDMCNEIYGKKKTYIMVILGFILNLMMILFFFMSKQLKPLWGIEAETWWLDYFAFTPRILLCSITSTVVATIVDVEIFDKMKRWFRKIEEKALPTKWLGLVSIRSFTTDVLNQIVDTVIFCFLAFVGIMDTQTLILFITGSTIVKVLVSIFDTPWFTLFRVLTKDVEREF